MRELHALITGQEVGSGLVLLGKCVLIAALVIIGHALRARLRPRR